MARVGPRTDGRFRRISPRSIRDVAGRRRDCRAGCDCRRIGCSRPHGGRRVGVSDGHGGGVPYRRAVRRQRFVSCRSSVSCDRHVLRVLGGGKRGATRVPTARSFRHLEFAEHRVRGRHMGRRVKIGLVASLATWAIVVAIWIALLDFDRSTGCPDFAPPPDSSAPYQGKAHWQWLPPGNRCEYRVFTFETVNDRGDYVYVHTDDPPTARLGILGLLVIWPVASVAFAPCRRTGHGGCGACGQGCVGRCAVVGSAVIRPSGRGP
jgi:hypothetical protein